MKENVEIPLQQFNAAQEVINRAKELKCKLYPVYYTESEVDIILHKLFQALEKLSEEVWE